MASEAADAATHPVLGCTPRPVSRARFHADAICIMAEPMRILELGFGEKRPDSVMRGTDRASQVRTEFNLVFGEMCPSAPRLKREF